MSCTTSDLQNRTVLFCAFWPAYTCCFLANSKTFILYSKLGKKRLLFMSNEIHYFNAIELYWNNCEQCCGSALVSLRIWIQHSLSMRIRIQLFSMRVRIQGFDDQKLKKTFTAEKINYIWGWSKIAIFLSQGLRKGRPSNTEVCIPQKRTSGLSKLEIFFTFVCYFCPPGSGSGSAFPVRIRIRIRSIKMNSDQSWSSGYGSTTLVVGEQEEWDGGGGGGTRKSHIGEPWQLGSRRIKIK